MIAMEQKILSAKIGPYPRPMPVGMLDPMPKVEVTYQDGKSEVLFEFYPDEISFREEEFIGLTRAEACELRTRKDVAFLRS